MKPWTVLASLLSCAIGAHGFPSVAYGTNGIQSKAARSLEFGGQMPSIENERERRAAQGVGFDAQTQYVSTEGQHAFIAPNFASGDQRGPCPGLNAAANHGYIDRSGADTIIGIFNGVQEAYGMSADFAAILALLGFVFTGNYVSLDQRWSIGGPHPKYQNVLGNAGGLLGSASGLSGSHNRYESDTSPTRGDQYLFGDGYRAINEYSQQYVAYVPKDPISSDALYENLFPYRVLASPAGYAFPKAMMSNHSEEFPGGYMTRDIFNSFFAFAETSSGALTWNEGHERIPSNWYRRAFGDEYSLPVYLGDVLQFALKDPRLLNAGGNMGAGDTFTPVDLSDLTGGVYKAGDLLKGNNLQCFTLSIIQAAGPAVLGLEGTLTKAFGMLSDALDKSLSGLGCPQMTNIDEGVFDKYPGYNKTQGAV